MKIIHFILWILLAPFVLSAVFISTVLYPIWEKWGEKL